ncbi:type I-E CRISPR-associated protein Cse2/CasB [Streptomyces olivaceus]|uniref:type I-E CRISPR-associated protein Cse2/CasB n=1 Tax=Streptomyces TaxID=1883 RepID=UPI001CCC0987|nr:MULTISPECIES: type I-E CRISPR-associated protein Cse2/CasB [Streptomyces]MBZ6199895.1 type I-E CRISPR-associated protein Cse2/CasB [Streptomyces olivaceus]MBZ6304810.1 type I-E CRISPR-associated protein Cse2/CasB [Streptomyces olivaceus]MBZ6317926.1 type I-E CRISPR-associated protein Cse2/CasB [Streptomyces olivaceus]MCC2266497.1 type I-E CRISPR-associated protein Cse2/CasB [Streptomyces sp. CT1-17]
MTTTASSSAPSVGVPVQQRVANLASSLVGAWQKGYLADRSHAVGALARLRRGAGREAGETPDLWNLIDTDPLHTTDAGTRPLSEQELVRAENALHAALTLWAFHQQSRRFPMHRPHTRERPGGLGSAVRRVMPADGIDAPVRTRLVRAGTAPDLVALTQRLRDIVALLRRDDIPLDYALLAGQLYVWQWPDGPAAVRRRWGRSFHEQRRTRPDTEQNTAPASDENTTPDTDKDAS